MEAGAILLHDVASNDVFEGLVELGQVVEAMFNHIRRPLVDLCLLICVASNCIFDRIFDDGADLFMKLCGFLHLRISWNSIV